MMADWQHLSRRRSMSRFVTTLKTEQTDRRTYKLLDDLVLADEDQRTIIVPAGASIQAQVLSDG